MKQENPTQTINPKKSPFSSNCGEGRWGGRLPCSEGGTGNQDRRRKGIVDRNPRSLPELYLVGYAVTKRTE